MTTAATLSAGFGAESRGSFEQLLGWLEADQATALSHAELEDELEDRGRELLRRMLQDHLSLRTATEQRLPDVADADGVVHAAVEAGHRRPLASIFGQVQCERLAYRHRGHPNLYPGDAALNLPIERHSHGLRRLAAIESSRGSFEQATAAITRATGQRIGKRQVEALAARAAVDVADFYAPTTHPQADEGDVLVLSADGKGIVMRPDSLRPATAKAAAKASTKLATRLSKGENATVNASPKSAPSTTCTPYPARPATYSAATTPTTATTATTARQATTRRSRRLRGPKPGTSGSPPASSTTPPRSSPTCSTRPSGATPTIGAPG